MNSIGAMIMDGVFTELKLIIKRDISCRYFRSLPRKAIILLFILITMDKAYSVEIDTVNAGDSSDFNIGIAIGTTTSSLGGLKLYPSIRWNLFNDRHILSLGYNLSWFNKGFPDQIISKVLPQFDPIISYHFYPQIKRLYRNTKTYRLFSNIEYSFQYTGFHRVNIREQEIINGMIVNDTLFDCRLWSIEHILSYGFNMELFTNFYLYLHLGWGWGKISARYEKKDNQGGKELGGIGWDNNGLILKGGIYYFF